MRRAGPWHGLRSSSWPTKTRSRRPTPHRGSGWSGDVSCTAAPSRATRMDAGARPCRNPRASSWGSTASRAMNRARRMRQDDGRRRLAMESTSWFSVTRRRRSRSGSSREPAAGPWTASPASCAGIQTIVLKAGQRARYTGGYWSLGVRRTGSFVTRSRVDPKRDGRVLVQITGPLVGDRMSRSSRSSLLQPGRTQEIFFFIPERGVLRGFVVDERRDSDPERTGLLRSGRRGRAATSHSSSSVRAASPTGLARRRMGGSSFAGGGDQVTAWHPDFSGSTVADSRRWTNRPGGTWRHPGQAPRRRRFALGGNLASSRRTSTGPGDRDRPRGTHFEFEGVESGAHALSE